MVRRPTGKITLFRDRYEQCPVELTADFCRFYQLNLPDAQRVMDPALMLRLLSGLAGYDESQYREFLLGQPAAVQAKRDGGEKRRLSYHRWSEMSALLLDIRNYQAAQINARIDKQSKAKPLPMLEPPNAPDEDTGSGEAGSSLGGMQALFGAFAKTS